MSVLLILCGKKSTGKSFHRLNKISELQFKIQHSKFKPMRPDLSRIASFYHKYINQVSQDDVVPALLEQGNDFISLMQSIPADKHDHAYAPGKWTLKEVFQHVIDAERIFIYRSLCVARKEAQSLPGFEENDYAANSRAASRLWEDLLEEFRLVRKSAEYLFNSFDEEQLQATGLANNNPMNVRAVGFVIAGHCQHHLTIIRERYL